MRLKVPFLGYALAGIAFLLPSVLLTAFLPFLINAQPIRAKLVREIESWTGGEVKIAGSISVQDFFSLSVEAENVEIGKLDTAAPIEGIKAERIVARIAWFNLLSGNFNFDKVKVSSAVVRMRANGLGDVSRLLLDFVSGPRNTPFDALILDDCVIALRSVDGKPYRRLKVTNAMARTTRSGRQLITSAHVVWKDREASLAVRAAFHSPSEARMPLRVTLSSDLLSGTFDGKADLTGAADAEGSLAFRSPDLAAAADWLEADISPAAIARPVSASGDFTLSEDQITLIGAEISVAGQTAKTGLTLKRGKQAPRLEGVLAFDSLDAMSLLAAPGESAAMTAPAPFRIPIESDLRVSAKTVTGNGVEAGPTAMVITSRPERLTAEIAELGFLGGDVRGTVVLDMTGASPHASARLSGESLDSAAFLRLAKQKDWLTGEADVNVEVEANFDHPGQILDRLVAHARVNFPEGGQMRLDIPRLATSTLGEANGWHMLDLTSAAFDQLRFDMTFKEGQISFANVLLATAAQQLNGRGEIDLAERSLDWRFLVLPAGESAQDAGAAAPSRDAGAIGSRLSIKGPWGSPTIRRSTSPVSLLKGGEPGGLEVSLTRR